MRVLLAQVPRPVLLGDTPTGPRRQPGSKQRRGLLLPPEGEACGARRADDVRGRDTPARESIPRRRSKLDLMQAGAFPMSRAFPTCPENRFERLPGGGPGGAQLGRLLVELGEAEPPLAALQSAINSGDADARRTRNPQSAPTPMGREAFSAFEYALTGPEMNPAS